MDFLGKNIGVDWHFPLQGIFQPRDGTCTSCLAEGLFATESPEAPLIYFFILSYVFTIFHKEHEKQIHHLPTPLGSPGHFHTHHVLSLSTALGYKNPLSLHVQRIASSWELMSPQEAALSQ